MKSTVAPLFQNKIDELIHNSLENIREKIQYFFCKWETSKHILVRGAMMKN